MGAMYRRLLSIPLATLTLASATPADAAISCDDQDAATTDSCLATTGCAHLATVAGGAGTDTTIQGNAAGGTLYADTCPSGQVMVGVSGTVGASWDQIQVVCGVPSLNDALAITLAAGATLPLRGTNVTTPAISMCPADQVVVGFDGRAGALMDQIALRCAPATFATGSYTVTPGTATAVAPVGGTGGVAFPTTDCGAGTIAIGANIRAGGSNDGFGLICGTYHATDGTDRDCDTVHDGTDNCVAAVNTDQVDTDHDGMGDVCDTSNDLDLDGDGVPDAVDNCPDLRNADQADSDANGIGDACDLGAGGRGGGGGGGGGCNTAGTNRGLAGLGLVIAAVLAARRRR